MAELNKIRMLHIMSVEELMSEVILMFDFSNLVEVIHVELSYE
jgi:hypothetical protein